MKLTYYTLSEHILIIFLSALLLSCNSINKYSVSQGGFNIDLSKPFIDNTKKDTNSELIELDLTNFNDKDENIPFKTFEVVKISEMASAVILGIYSIYRIYKKTRNNKNVNDKDKTTRN